MMSKVCVLFSYCSNADDYVSHSFVIHLVVRNFLFILPLFLLTMLPCTGTLFLLTVLLLYFFIRTYFSAHRVDIGDEIDFTSVIHTILDAFLSFPPEILTKMWLWFLAGHGFFFCSSGACIAS